MGLLDKLKGKKDGASESREIEEDEENQDVREDSNEAKYAESTCALCGGTECDKKWAGQFWHKKCYRKMRKAGKGML